jgi:hypothetical protein
MSTPQPNPFMHAGYWYWRDEDGKVSRAFYTQRGALRDLLRTLDAREQWWAWFCQKAVEFWHDTRGTRQGLGQSGPKG